MDHKTAVEYDKEQYDRGKYARLTPELMVVFRKTLLDLFEEYPPVTPPGHIHSAQYWREKATNHLITQHGAPATAAYWASDTGVPNDMIDAAFTLLFL